LLASGPLIRPRVESVHFSGRPEGETEQPRASALGVERKENRPRLKQAGDSVQTPGAGGSVAGAALADKRCRLAMCCLKKPLELRTYNRSSIGHTAPRPGRHGGNNDIANGGKDAHFPRLRDEADRSSPKDRIEDQDNN